MDFKTDGSIDEINIQIIAPYNIGSIYFNYKKSIQYCSYGNSR